MTQYNNEYAKAYNGWKNDYVNQMNQHHSQSGSFHQLSEQDKEKEARVKAELEKLSRQELREKAKNLLKNQNVPVTKVSEDVALNTCDLSFILAMSMQQLDSTTNPETEYRDWVRIEDKIETDIKTGGTTDAEIQARNHFISVMNHRETEMKYVIALYSAAAMNAKGYYRDIARQKLSFMLFKLSELRRLRARMERTKSKSDRQEKTEKKIQEAGLRYLSVKAGNVLEESLLDSDRFPPVTTSEDEIRDKINQLKARKEMYRRRVLALNAYNRGVIDTLPEETGDNSHSTESSPRTEVTAERIRLLMMRRNYTLSA